MARVAVIGAGYVGIVVATSLAHIGHRVVVGERDSERIKLLESGDPVIHEPRLEELLKGALSSGTISFTPDNRVAVDRADVVFLALPTPSDAGGSADVSAIYGALEELASTLSPTSVVVTKSTVPVGENERIAAFLASKGCQASVVSNPEFLQEGSAVEHFLNPDRIVIGGEDPEAVRRVMDLYRTLPGLRLSLTDTATAELVKYASNAFLAMKIAFINEIADLCTAAGADVLKVAEGMGMDDRIGLKFLRPGPGYGGSCFPKDTQALVHIGNTYGADQSIVRAVVASNEGHKEHVVRRVAAELGGLAGKRLGLLGVAFKAGTDDIRESPALSIAGALAAGGARVSMYDPQAAVPEEMNVSQSASWEEAVAEADAVLILTEWPQFSAISPAELADLMAGTLLFDTRNILDPEAVVAAGLQYLGMGRV